MAVSPLPQAFQDWQACQGRKETLAGPECLAPKEIMAGQVFQAYQVSRFLPSQTQAHNGSKTDLPVEERHP